MAAIDARTPVIVGVHDLADRPAPPGDGDEPLKLLLAATQGAVSDAGCAESMLAELHSIDIINVLSWPYHDLAAEFTHALGCSPRHAEHTPAGGDMAQRCLHQAANRIASGEIDPP